MHEDSQEDSFDIPFIQKSHTTTIHCPDALISSESSNSRPSVEFQEDQEEDEFQPILTVHSECSSQVPLSVSSEDEECTRSYLTLCHEYEQDKVEPEALGEEEENAKEAKEDSADFQGDCSGAEGLPKSYRGSTISSDSLCSPGGGHELSFFTEEDDEIVEPPTPLSLDQLKRSPMELFRIDSKDSVDTSRMLFSTSDLGSEVTEDPLEIGEVVEVKGHLSDLWRFDSDQGSNESVPVISFKEAMADEATTSCVDEGQPPDLLVNLPGVTGITGDNLEQEFAAAGVAFAVEANPSPQFGKPDVLQLGEEAGLEPVEEHAPGISVLRSQSNPDAAGQKDHFSSTNDNKESKTLSLPFDCLTPRTENDPTHPPPSKGSEVTEKREGRSVSEIFRELDELADVALHMHLPESLVRSWAVDMLLALNALHKEGIICKDLNPNNILLDYRGHVELTYFCSWGEVEESCDPTAVTKMYCAPEVGGISEETAASDWWSLGALLFELLTGKDRRKEDKRKENSESDDSICSPACETNPAFLLTRPCRASQRFFLDSSQVLLRFLSGSSQVLLQFLSGSSPVPFRFLSGSFQFLLSYLSGSCWVLFGFLLGSCQPKAVKLDQMAMPV
ncbi:Ribosomal protein S6 kinase delta-1 [Bagarius yarrelli]|uniref:Ribosomal protein S6 kinase delta-1 n=1 Tax=Bagarius yarrelli TaxID=175774 RepID=A0A556TZB9_BAGYA|nr:Ribosomal protein S6 kinase delta-1 [Bagarius yarrelli]